MVYIHFVIRLAGCALGFTFNCMSVFYTPVASLLNETQGSVSTYSSICSLVNAVFSIITPRLMNQKNFKKIITAGAIGSVVACVGFGFAQNIFLYYVFAVLLGISASTYSAVIITTILNNSIKESAGLYTGLVFSFSGIVGAVFSPIFSAIIEASSVKYAYLAMAALYGLFCLPAIFAPLSYEEKAAEKGEKVKFNYRDGLFGYVCVGLLAIRFLPGVCQHFSTLMQTKGFANGAMMVSAVMVGNIVFKLIAGSMVDKIGVTKTSLILTIINVVSGIMIILTDNYYLLLVFGFGFGVCYATTSVLTPLIVRDIYPANLYGTVFSLINFAGTLINSLAISAAGYIYDFTGTYNVAIIICLVGCVLMVICMNILYSKKAKLVQQ